MLNRYFIRPTTIDRIRASWIGEAIEHYVGWLTDRNYATRTVFFRVPVLVRFGEVARESGARNLQELPAHVEPFVEELAKASSGREIGCEAPHCCQGRSQSTSATAAGGSPP